MKKHTAIGTIRGSSAGITRCTEYLGCIVLLSEESSLWGPLSSTHLWEIFSALFYLMYNSRKGKIPL